jgi:hypothetical protein
MAVHLRRRNVISPRCTWPSPLVSLSLSLCPRTPCTPLPLCRSFSHPSLHFGPLHQHCSPPGVKSVLCVCVFGV